jgi:hypothetical protein
MLHYSALPENLPAYSTIATTHNAVSVIALAYTSPAPPDFSSVVLPVAPSVIVSVGPRVTCDSSVVVDGTVGVSDVMVGVSDVMVGVSDVTVGVSDVTVGVSDVTVGVSDVTVGVSDVMVGVSDVTPGISDVTSGISDVVSVLPFASILITFILQHSKINSRF